MISTSLSRAMRASAAQRWSLVALLGVALAIAVLPRMSMGAEAPVVHQVDAAQTPDAQAAAVRRGEPATMAVGHTTRALLAAQADGRHAGHELGILGPVASASWKRYVESFTYPQPELFEQRLENNSSN